MRHALAVLLASTLLVACSGGGVDLLPALTDDSTCEEAAAVVAEALEEGRLYIGTNGDDAFLADQLIFALSAVEERPECFDDATIRQARGLRTTLAG